MGTDTTATHENCSISSYANANRRPLGLPVATRVVAVRTELNERFPGEMFGCLNRRALATRVSGF